MFDLRYSYDGKGKWQSAELSTSISLNDLFDYEIDIYIGSYGENLDKCLNNIFKDIISLRNKIDYILEDIIEGNINIIDGDNNCKLEEERLTDYYSGEKYTKPVKETIDKIVAKYNKEKQIMGKRYNYEDEMFESVTVKGIECQFNNSRIDRDSVPKDKFLYEVGGDDDCGDEPSRVKKAILVNFFGTIISDVELPLGEDGVLWIENEEDFIFNN